MEVLNLIASPKWIYMLKYVEKWQNQKVKISGGGAILNYSSILKL
jgi:hypothetical protein